MVEDSDMNDYLVLGGEGRGFYCFGVVAGI